MAAVLTGQIANIREIYCGIEVKRQKKSIKRKSASFVKPASKSVTFHQKPFLAKALPKNKKIRKT